MQGALLWTLYDSVVALAILYGVACCRSSITATERKKLNKLVKKASLAWAVAWIQ